LNQCKRGASLNAFITLRPEAVLEAARACRSQTQRRCQARPLHGLPIPIKDSCQYEGPPDTAETPALRNFQADEDAPWYTRLREAGAIVSARPTCMSSFFTLRLHEQQPRLRTIHNPYDPACYPSSSGGTAAAIAYHMQPARVCEDTEGSIRVLRRLRAAGFRPTPAGTRRTPVRRFSPLFDQVGPHARSVADLLLFDAALTVVEPLHPPVF